MGQLRESHSEILRVGRPALYVLFGYIVVDHVGKGQFHPVMSFLVNTAHTNQAIMYLKIFGHSGQPGYSPIRTFFVKVSLYL